MFNGTTSSETSGITRTDNSRGQQFLPQDFSPGCTDVIIGRGKKCSNHEGNKNLRSIVSTRMEEYSMAVTKSEKSKVLTAVVIQIRTGNPRGKFIKQDADTKLWFDIGDVLAKEKISQTFRDALVGLYRSSNEFKKKRRHEMKREENALKREEHARSKRARMQAVPTITTMQQPVVGQHQVNDYLNYLLACRSMGNQAGALNTDPNTVALLTQTMGAFENPFEPTPIANIEGNEAKNPSNMTKINRRNDQLQRLDGSAIAQQLAFNNKAAAQRKRLNIRPDTNISSAKTA